MRLTFRPFSVAAALVAFFFLETADAAPDATLASTRPASAVPVSPDIAAYRQYAKNQAENLVLMTRALATGIKNGDLDAAQSTYGPAHRFFKRIEPLARLSPGAVKTMDLSATAYEKKEADPKFSGFHLIEYALFARGSTENLAGAADRLASDSQALLEQISLMEISSDALLDETAGLLDAVAAEGLSGKGEPYSKTDLWNLEANIDGAGMVLALVRPRVRTQGMAILFRTAAHIAKIGALLEKNKQGCGFKNLDEVSGADKSALIFEVSAVAKEVANLRETVATN